MSRYVRVIVLFFYVILPCSQLSAKAISISPAPPYDAPTLRAHEKVSKTQKVSKDKKGAHEKKKSHDFGKQRKETDLKILLLKDPTLRRPIKVKEGEVFVKFRKGTSASKRKTIVSKHRASLDGRRKVSRLQKIEYHRVRVPFGVDIEKLLLNLKQESTVEAIEFNAIVHSLSTTLEENESSGQWGINAIKAKDAWSITRGSPSVLVGVVDSGIDPNHPALRDNIVFGYNFLDDTEKTEDHFGHGTQVAGIIAAKDDNISVGVAPDCRIVPLKVLDANGDGTVAAVANAIIYAADQGCKIINLSLGTYYDSGMLKTAVEYAWNKGCVLVAAGGNEGANEACYPAAYYQTIGVGAIDRRSSACSFSNRANYIDIAAPGKEILTTSLNGEYCLTTGTSPSAAYVSGLVALLFSHRTDISNENIESIIRSSSEDIGKDGWDQSTGMGLIDCKEALSSNQINGPDIGIIDMYTLPANPMPGQRANVIMTVRNHDLFTVENAQLILGKNEIELCSTEIVRLKPKQLCNVTLPWDSSKQQTVETLTAKVPPLPSESRLFDNHKELSVNITSDIIHDIGIIDYSISGLPIEVGKQLLVSLTVANLGNVDESDVEAAFFFEDIEVSSQNINTFATGSTRELFFAVNIPDDISSPHDLQHGFKLHINLAGISEDIAEHNNNKTLRFKVADGSARHIFPLHKVGSGEEVHQWIVKEAYDFFTSQIEGSSLASYLTKSGLSPSSSWSSLAAATHDYDGDNNVLEGSKDEDEMGENPSPFGSDHYLTPYLYHFCAGADDTEISDGLGVWDSAYTIANWYRSSYWTGNNASSYYYLGHFSHLLADMTIPAHTHNDEHLFSEPYEDDVADYGWYTDFYYGDSYGHWGRVISRPTSALSLFRATADYTEDYDSEDEAGDWDATNDQAYSNTKHDDALYYPLTMHKPSLVNGSGINGMTSSETWTTAKDLVPFAIYRTAQAYRYFYYKTDASGPTVNMTYPASEDFINPTQRDNMNSFSLTSSASDSQSGILKEGYQFFWSYWTGSAWSNWSDVNPSPTDSSVSFTPTYDSTLYAFQVASENGGGLISYSNVKYLFVQTPQIVDDKYEDNDTLSTFYDLSNYEQTWLSAILGPGKQFDDDYYKIDVTPDYERVLIDCQFTDTDGDIDIELLDSSGTKLADSDSTNDDEYIDHIVPSSGTYYIRVFYGDAGNVYDLWWDDIIPPLPDLSYHSSQIDDDDGGGSYGNGDGQINAGETIELKVTLQNTANVDAHNVTAHLETSDSYVTSISDADENYGDIASGTTGVCISDYDFTISPSCPDGHIITFNLNPINSDEGTWSDSFKVTVFAQPTGELTVNLNPNEAVNDGVQWKLTTGPDTNWKNSGDMISSIPIGGYIIEFKTIDGWKTPDVQNVSIATSGLIVDIEYEIELGPDINRDGKVNIEDFAILSDEWLGNICMLAGGWCNGADIDYSGIVNVADLLIVVEHWLETNMLLIEDFESGGLSSWNFGGDTPAWSISTDQKNSGSYAVKSGAITDGQMTYIYLSQEVQRGYISFARKVSSEYGDDWLEFFVDGELVDITGGESDWKARRYFINSGAHTFFWAYEKGGLNAAGSDCAWIDDVVFYPQNTDISICAWAELTASKVLGESMTIQPVQNCGYIPYYETWAIIVPGGSFTGTFECPATGQYELRVKHLSSYSASCQGDGHSPVTIKVNGSTIVSEYDPAENHGGTHGLVTDTWIINANAGTNTFEWSANDLCTNYWIQNIEIKSSD